jgi:hypothetical protein
LLLVGRSGTGKTFLLNTLSEALGLEHRHYNASLISFDDLVGFPYPDEAHATVRFLETPATVWGAESVLANRFALVVTAADVANFRAFPLDSPLPPRPSLQHYRWNCGPTCHAHCSEP